MLQHPSSPEKRNSRESRSEKLDCVDTPMPDHVIVELKIAVVSKREQRWVANGRKLATDGHLRISAIERIHRDVQQPCFGGKVISCIGAGLSARDRQEPKPRFI